MTKRLVFDPRPFVPRLLSADLARAGGPSVVHLDGTLMFADLSGFTSLSERLGRLGPAGAEELTAVVDATFVELLVPAYEAGGSMLKFGGDALLLLFDGPQHAPRACYAAENMRRILRKVGKLQTPAGKAILRMSVGLHSGQFPIFVVGKSHRELVIAGPHPSVLAAAEAEASAGEILMSAATAALVDPRILGQARGNGFLLREVRQEAPSSEHRAPDVESEVADSISAFVPSQLRSFLASGGGQAEHRTASIAFLYCGQTDEVVARDPVAAASVFDETISRVQQSADAMDVTFLTSDISPGSLKIILAAGVPSSGENDEERLLRAVRDIMEARLPLPLRAGISHGKLFAGTIGPVYRRTYTVMGDVVNTAARVMVAANPGQLLVTDGFFERLGGRYTVIEKRTITVKGRTKTVTVVEPGKPVTGRVRRDTEFFGRHQESDSLRAATMQPGMSEVVGPAGFGKSALVSEVLGNDVIVAECQPFSTTIAYAAIRDPLRVLCGADPGDDPASVGAALTRAVNDRVPGLAPWLPLLALACGAEVEPTPETESLGREFRQARLFESVAELLDASRPEVPFVVEDVQWLDSATTGLLPRIARSRPVVMTRRPGSDPIVGVVTIELNPLSDDDMRHLARAVAGDLLPHTLDLVLLAADGNPLFLSQMARAAAAGDPIGADVHAVLTAAIDRLSPPDRDLLRRVAVLGGSALASDLVAVGTDAKTVSSRLRDFVVVDGPVVRFRHALERDVAYNAMPFRRRSGLHAAVADHLTSRNAGAESIAVHTDAAGLNERTWDVASQAARAAVDKFAYEESAAFWRMAVGAGRKIGADPAEIGRAWWKLGEVELWAGRFAESSASLGKARKLLRNDPDAVGRLCLLEAAGLDRVGRYTDALRWLGRGLTAVRKATPDVNPQTAIRIQESYSYVRWRQGRVADCVKWARAALADADQIGDAGGRAHAYHHLLLAAVAAGDEKRSEYGRQALKYAAERGNVGLQADIRNTLGIDAYRRGDWDEAAEHYRLSREAQIAFGDQVHAAVATNNLAEILLDQGHLAAAESAFEDVVSTFKAAGMDGYSFAVQVNLARACQRSGAIGRAQDLLDESLAAFVKMGAAGQVMEVQLRIAEGLVMSGRADDALQLIATMDSQMPAAVKMAVGRLTADALTQLGRFEDAASALTEAQHLASESGAVFESALIKECAARLERAKGADVSSLVDEVQPAFERLGVLCSPRVPLRSN